MLNMVFRFFILIVFIFSFTWIVFADSSQKYYGTDTIKPLPIVVDDTVTCMALYCPNSKIPERIRPEPVEPLPIVVDDTITCMALHCSKPNEPVKPYLPPPLPPDCLGAYIDESGQVRDVCKEKKLKELDDKIKKQQKKVKQEAYEELTSVNKYKQVLRNKNSTKKQIVSANNFAKKQRSERVVAQDVLKKLQKEKKEVEKK